MIFEISAFVGDLGVDCVTLRTFDCGSWGRLACFTSYGVTLPTLEDSSSCVLFLFELPALAGSFFSFLGSGTGVDGDLAFPLEVWPSSDFGSLVLFAFPFLPFFLEASSSS